MSHSESPPVLHAFQAELSRLMGWYSFQREINIAHPKEMCGYPERLIIDHESAHLALTSSSLYGQILIFLGSVINNVRDKGADLPLRDIHEVFHTLVGRCFVVQEAIAMHHEMVYGTGENGQLIDLRLRMLHPDHAKSLRYLEDAFGSVRELRADRDRAFVKDFIATTLARCAMDSPDLAQFADVSSLTLPSVQTYLSQDSPDGRFISACESISKQGHGDRLITFWNSQAMDVCSRLGIAAKQESALIQYFYLDTKTVDQVNLEVQPLFLKYAAQLGHLQFTWMATIEDRTDKARRVLRGWRTFFDETKKSELFPFQDVEAPRPRDAWKDTRRVHHVRRQVNKQAVSRAPIRGVSVFFPWAVDQINDGLTPLISVESAEGGHIAVVGWGLRRPNESPKGYGYQFAKTPVLGRTTYEKLEAFEEALLLFSSETDDTMDEKSLWHFQAELLQQGELNHLVASTLGRCLGSWNSFDFEHINAVIQSHITRGWDTTIRHVRFKETPLEMLVLNCFGTPIYHSWIGTKEDFVYLATEYESTKRVIVGDSKIQSVFGPLEDAHEIHALLSVAYPHVGEPAAGNV